jgi:hypothetical protein
VRQSQNFNSVSTQTIQHQHLFETGYLEDSQRLQIRVLKARMPSYLWLYRQESNGFMGSEEKAMTGFEACFRCRVVRLFVAVLVGLGTHDVDGVHREPVFPRALVQPNMLFLPIRCSNLNWRTRIQPFKRLRFQFPQALLICDTRRSE